MTSNHGTSHTSPPGGNLFAELGVPNARNLQVRSQLMREILQWYQASGLTQVQAADKLGTTQAHLDDVLRGRIEKCTIERLVNMLAAVGFQVTVRVQTAEDT